MIYFAFDNQRNYCQNDVNSYFKHLDFLKSNFPKHSYTVTPNGFDRTQEEWAKLQNKKEKLPFQLKRGTFYIFFEMPERCQKYYNFYKIPYLNFMIPKIRFNTLQECYMLESNLNIPEEYFINNIKMPKVKLIPEYQEKTLILGQMVYDRTTIFEGISKSVFDYPICGDIFRIHPGTVKYQPEHAKKELTRASELGLELDKTDNVYDVLHSVKKAVGISSGALYEANLLGTNVQFLDEKEYINRAKLISKDTINKNFWRFILSLI